MPSTIPGSATAESRIPHPRLGFYLRDDLTRERAEAVIKRLAAAASSSRYHGNSRNISEQARLSCSPWGSGEQLFNVCKSALKAGGGNGEGEGRGGVGNRDGASSSSEGDSSEESHLRSSPGARLTSGSSPGHGSALVPPQDTAGKYPRRPRELQDCKDASGGKKAKGNSR